MAQLLEGIFKVILKTPMWVWIIFVYLVFIGVRSTKPRVVYVPQLFIIPLILIGLKFKLFLTGSYLLLSGYFFSLILAAFFRYKLVKSQNINFVQNTMLVKIPGTFCVLIMLMAFFVIKYIFGYISVINPALYSNIQIFELCLSGLISGHFLGTAMGYLAQYKKVSDVE